jgi:hypothetical protein
MGVRCIGYIRRVYCFGNSRIDTTPDRDSTSGLELRNSKSYTRSRFNQQARTHDVPTTTPVGHPRTVCCYSKLLFHWSRSDYSSPQFGSDGGLTKGTIRAFTSQTRHELAEQVSIAHRIFDFAQIPQLPHLTDTKIRKPRWQES